MFCEKCNSATDVTDSRDTGRASAGEEVMGMPSKARRRRIRCRECSHTSTTYEFHASDLKGINRNPCTHHEKTLSTISDLLGGYVLKPVKEAKAKG